ncbi:hypothetical protein [Solidesulfovibrio sp. C21]|uniref:hypothetical protein n=1 Tax=Solidesulfovibrio sp. C21 TaxID=3398613 RepID=UPI0039FC190B
MSAFFVPTQDQIKQLAGENAAACSLPLPTVLAVIEVESGGDIWAWNPEPKW